LLIVLNTLPSRARLDAVVHAMLIFVVLFHVHFYHYWAFRIWKKHGRAVSLLKLCAFVANNIGRIYDAKGFGVFEKEVAYYACYEKRKKRPNQLEICFLGPKALALKQS
jgi:hypothetical protein